MWHIWLIIAGVCFILEIITVGFFMFWFGIGAIVALLVSFLFPSNIFLQTLVFVIVSVILLFLTKPLVNKFTKKDKKINTNAYSIIGKTGIVTQDINPTYSIGRIKVSNEVWSAKTADGSVIEKGNQVEIVNIDGVKAVVECVSNKTSLID